VFKATGRSVAEKIARIGELKESLLLSGDRHGVLAVWWQLAILEHRRNDLDAAVALQRRKFAQARELGRLPDVCRAYGQLLNARMSDGLTAADRDTLQDLIAQARRARLAAVSSHLLCLQGYDEYWRGRSAASRTAFEDGIEVCREFGEPAAAVSTMVILLRMYASLECWDQVATLLERANRLLDEAVAGREPTAGERLSRTQLDNLAARRLAALGQADAAHQVFRQTFTVAGQLPHAEVGYVGRQWFEAMMDADRPDLAAEIFAALAPFIAAGDLPLLAPRIPYWRAWFDWRQGDLAAATAHLDQFQTEGLLASPSAVVGLEHQYLALKARVLWPADRQAATDLLLRGWRALQDRLLAREPGSEAYLDLNRNPHLRWAAQDLLANGPRLGYGLELLWREVMLLRASSLDSLSGLTQGARAQAAAAQRYLAASGAVHCVYRLRPDGIMRWTAHGAQVEQDLLEVSSEALRAQVMTVLEQLQDDPCDPDAPIPAALARSLGDLAQVLLPERFFDAQTRPRRLYVSVEGFLNQVPFAPLNVGRGDTYEPLIATTDLAWVRHGPTVPAEPDGQRILVVADPVLDAATRRRFGLSAGLAGARSELASIVSMLPNIEVLQGEQATRARVCSVWNQMSVLYFVGHAITDPLVPFFAWLPLSGDGEAAAHPGLGVKDILSQRFDGCEAVFLSGCATGAAFVDGLATAPSLGDAFLDAGAAAAVQTFWLVRDRHSPVRPDRMLTHWRTSEADLVEAVSLELRTSMQGPHGIRHPFTWAAWTVNVRGW